MGAVGIRSRQNTLFWIPGARWGASHGHEKTAFWSSNPYQDIKNSLKQLHKWSKSHPTWFWWPPPLVGVSYPSKRVYLATVGLKLGSTPPEKHFPPQKFWCLQLCTTIEGLGTKMHAQNFFVIFFPAGNLVWSDYPTSPRSAKLRIWGFG